MSAGLEASTVTPGSTAPDESLTTPVIDAWACAADGSSTNRATTMHAALTRMNDSLRFPLVRLGSGLVLALKSGLIVVAGRGERTAKSRQINLQSIS